MRRVWVSLAAVLLIALGGLAAWALTTPALRVQHVQVVGTRDPALVTQIRGLPLTGCTIFRCDLAQATARVAALPAVAQAEVTRLYPDTLVVHVTPRAPVLIWKVADHPYLVAADGTLIGPADPASASKWPVVSDPQAAAVGGPGHAHAGARLARPLVEMAAQLLSRLSGALGSGSALRYDANAGLVASDGNGLEVAFGDPSRPPYDAPGGMPGQLAELRSILALLARQGETASWIDLRWGDHPYYRLART